MKTRTLFSKSGYAAVAMALFGVATLPVAAQTVNLTPTTIIPVRLNSALSSQTAQAGDTFTATVNNDKQAYNNVMQGATVTGVVKDATPQEGKQPGTLDLKFTSLHLSDGRTLALNGTPTSLNTKSVTTDSDGMLVAKNTNKDQHLTYAGYGAGAGILMGLVSGGKIKIEDILIGTALGYGAGSVLKGPQQVHDVELKAGSDMGVLVGRNVSYHRTTPRGNGYGNGGGYSTTNNIKYYSYNGDRWAMNRTTGQRWMLSRAQPISSGGGYAHTTTSNVKYYSYMGHPYRLDQSTGERTQLD